MIFSWNKLITHVVRTNICGERCSISERLDKETHTGSKPAFWMGGRWKTTRGNGKMEEGGGRRYRTYENWKCLVPSTFYLSKTLRPPCQVLRSCNLSNGFTDSSVIVFSRLSQLYCKENDYEGRVSFRCDILMEKKGKSNYFRFIKWLWGNIFANGYWNNFLKGRVL